MVEDEYQPITRGVNPVPPGGWPWHPTDYEVACIREFEARPVSEGWSGMPEENYRSDREMYDAHLNAPVWVPQRRQYRLWLWALVTLAVVAVGAGAATFGIINLHTAASVNESTSNIEDDR